MAATISEDQDRNTTAANWPASYAVLVAPHDTNELLYVSRGLWVGGTGDLRVLTIGGNDVTIVGVQQGSLIPIRVRKVYATSTTATNILSFY